MVKNSFIKLLNSTIVDLCRELEAFWMADKLEEYREANMHRIDTALDIASSVLTVVPEEIRKGKTWVYDRGGEPDYDFGADEGAEC